MDYFKKLMNNKNFFLLLFIFNVIGTIAALYTYWYTIVRYVTIGNVFIIPFLMVSFWLFLFASFITLYLYLGKKVPQFIGSIGFVYCFVYGFGAALFYILFMTFVRGITIYHVWNIFAHGFVGLQSLLFLRKINKPKFNYLMLTGFVFISKDLLDLFGGGFLYFLEFRFASWLKIVLSLMILSLQVIAFYLLFRIGKRLK